MIEHFNGNAPSSDCVKDEESIIWYGNNGVSRDAYATRHCSNQGYFGRNGQSRDCSDWRFQENCQEARPSDWSPCYRDEESKNRGYANRDDEGNQWCKSKGYFGYDGQKDCNSWYYSFHCSNPSWRGEWNNGGCQADGQIKYWRQVDAKNFDWDQAANWLIKNDTNQYGFSSIWKERNNGMYVVALRNENNCFIYNEAEKTNECDFINNRQRMSKKCNNWPNGWLASSDVVNACKKNAPNGSEIKIIGSEVWAQWYKNNNCSYKDDNFVYNENINITCDI